MSLSLESSSDSIGSHCLCFLFQLQWMRNQCRTTGSLTMKLADFSMQIVLIWRTLWGRSMTRAANWTRGCRTKCTRWTKTPRTASTAWPLTSAPWTKGYETSGTVHSSLFVCLFVYLFNWIGPMKVKLKMKNIKGPITWAKAQKPWKTMYKFK